MSGVFQNIDLEWDFAAAVLSVCGPLSSYDFILPRPPYTLYTCIQGGSDISGTLSKLHRRIKKSYFFLIISHKTVSALFRNGNKIKQTHSSKY